MDINQKTEEKQIFQIEMENDKKENKKQKKVLMLASDNLRRLVIENISGRTGRC